MSSVCVCVCVCVSATLCQVTCLRAVGEFVYVATTFGCIIVIDTNAMSVSAVCRPYTRPNPQITAIFPLTDYQSQSTDPSRDPSMVRWRHSRLVTVGHGYADLVRQTVSQYSSSVSTSHGCELLVWSDSEWTSHTRHKSGNN